MTKVGKQWAFSLVCINLAVGLVLLIESSANQFASIRDLLRAAAYGLVYANLTGILGTLVMGSLAERLAERGVSLRFVLPVGLVVLTAVGGLLAQLLLMQLGFVEPNYFWPEYLNTLRVATPLALVFGFGAFVHGSLRSRVEIMEEKLHAQQLAEERTRKLAVEARLRSLEARVHPHFLFNTLN